MPKDSLSRLADVIQQGLRSVPEKGVRPLLEGLFGERFQKRHFEPSPICTPRARRAGVDPEARPPL